MTLARTTFSLVEKCMLLAYTDVSMLICTHHGKGVQSLCVPSYQWPNVTFLKCICHQWRYLMLDNPNIAQSVPKCHILCADSFDDSSFHWPTSLSTCGLVMSDASTPWLFLHAISWRRFPKDKNSWLMKPLQKANISLPIHIHHILMLKIQKSNCNLKFINFNYFFG